VDLDESRGDADEEALAECRVKAAEALSTGQYAAACAHFTACVNAGPPSALMLAHRAECLVRLSKPVAAVRDCDAALALNPDNGKVSLGRAC
jgi:suppressor of tumorigenicity protein 13